MNKILTIAVLLLLGAAFFAPAASAQTPRPRPRPVIVPPQPVPQPIQSAQ